MEWGVGSCEAVGERERDYASHADPNLHHKQELMKSTAITLRSSSADQGRPCLISDDSTKICEWALRCPSTQPAHPPAILDFLYSRGNSLGSSGRGDADAAKAPKRGRLFPHVGKSSNLSSFAPPVLQGSVSQHTRNCQIKHVSTPKCRRPPRRIKFLATQSKLRTITVRSVVVLNRELVRVPLLVHQPKHILS